MRLRLYGCGCSRLLDRNGETLRDVCCAGHAPVGRAATVLSQLAGAADLWKAIEAAADAGVRELGHTYYHLVQRTVGELEGQLALERESTGSRLEETSREGLA